MPGEAVTRPLEADNYALIDIEVSVNDNKIHDIGALRHDGASYHNPSVKGAIDFIRDVDYVCGHNIIGHDAKYLFRDTVPSCVLVDTLYMSPILFPDKPYHKLVKDEKLVSEEINNPVNDCKKAYDLLMDEIERWNSLPEVNRTIFTSLLWDKPEFIGFLKAVNASEPGVALTEMIQQAYEGKICQNADLDKYVKQSPCALAYALALIGTSDYHSITPGWVLYNYPETELIVHALRYQKCSQGCSYCDNALNPLINLKKYFGYDKFRTFDGEPLQERSVEAAINGQSLLTIFPTGGGKSLTFQLPALMAGRAVHGLTVVISPLQSLMKDQVDNLAEKGITDAVTINGMLDPITRAMCMQQVRDGEASLLYIAPEMLRSKTIERILLARNVVRFVIDEAHCFSSWGQDFRIDYLYIGRFISEYQKKKKSEAPIPVSCFTATAKQKVIKDICDYFKQTLNLDLKVYASAASRINLRYSMIYVANEADKYMKLRQLISERHCPTIVYVSRTKRTKELAAHLTRDGFKALPFNGRMNPDEKVANQEAFMNDKVGIIVATSAFGMGVDKSDIGLVIHYDISDSLENYVQEAGRAGRDPSLMADAIILYADNDLDKHFILQNQTKLNFNEIQQVWKAVKTLTRQRTAVNCSALEIARAAGWDDSVTDIETRVKTAIAALEQSGYLVRGNNVPHVYATGITVRNVAEATQRITRSLLFDGKEIEHAVRVIKSLISQKHIAKAQNAEAESRIDYLSDMLGLRKGDVISVVERMRQEGILADSKDISAYLLDAGESERRSRMLLDRFASLEKYLLSNIPDETLRISSKQLNENALTSGISTSKEKDIRTLLYFLTIKGYAKKNEDAYHNLELQRLTNFDTTMRRFEKRVIISRYTVEWLYEQAANAEFADSPKRAVQFSVVELLEKIKSSAQSILGDVNDIRLEDVEEALLYLSKIGALKLDGGFLVLYNAMNIKRLKEMKLRYKQEDYRQLNEFYQLKIQQIHIVGEYARLMLTDPDGAQTFVHDYFHMEYRRFIDKYFKGERVAEIQRNLTPEKYRQLFGQLSERQMQIISDKESSCIIVAAGPGSGKTRVLVHKLASLILLEDVKHEQLLMLTFSRAAATEFKQRLIELIGNAAHFVEIKTFHSYCFDLLGRLGNIEDAKDVVSQAAQMIRQGDVEPNKIGKMVLVIDEAQDMGENEFALVKALMDNNEEMRVIAVGDDDQNIYEFRGSNSGYMFGLMQRGGSRMIEMTENYRSASRVVAYANAFLQIMGNRHKKTAIISRRSDIGCVEVVKHGSKYMYRPLVDHLIRNRAPRGASVCVLTQTNEEAVTVVAMLRKHGINSKLIQSIEGFKFWNIAEVRYFIKYIEKRLHTPLISDELWEEAKAAVFKAYSTSAALSYLRVCIEQFEEVNKAKYITDLKEFVFESSVEDFCDVRGADVVVSTIHKAKGREFDDVYMLVAGSGSITPELMRRYYVGITRAKNRLFIHTDIDMFMLQDVSRCVTDQAEYDLPERIVLQLSHKDVYLDYFIGRKKQILALRAGDELIYKDNRLFAQLTEAPVAVLSNRMRDTLAKWESRGYAVSSVQIRFIVAWRPKDEQKSRQEEAVILADLTLSR